VITLPVTPADEDKATDDLIRRLGREIKERPPVPPTYSPPDQPRSYGPGEPPTPYAPPPPTIYGSKDKPPCCGMMGDLITYPITQDPMRPPKELEAAQDPPICGAQVYLHA